MSELHMSYSDLETMPMEYIEWFYRKDYYEKNRDQNSENAVSGLR